MSKVIMGFSFDSEEEYFIAKKELEYINKLQDSITTNNPEYLLEIYNKIIRDGIFKTPIGMEYLRSIQLKLYEGKQIDNDRIQNIPAIVYKKTINSPKEAVHASDHKKNTPKGSKYKDLYIKMLIVNVALVIIIGIMFTISHNAEKFDEDYYRESIENEYIRWEQSLQERESALNGQENN